jgi:hypothetical protein
MAGRVMTGYGKILWSVFTTFDNMLIKYNNSAMVREKAMKVLIRHH